MVSNNVHHGWLPVLISACCALGGCSAMMSRESPLNDVTKDAPTALEVYRGTGRARAADTAAAADDPRELLHAGGRVRAVSDSDARDNPYWSPLEPMRQRFGRLPNPDLVMVVYPHLSQGKYPVPGYVTTFPMYEEVHYVLPGEMAREAQSVREGVARVHPGSMRAGSAQADPARARPGNDSDGRLPR